MPAHLRAPREGHDLKRAFADQRLGRVVVAIDNGESLLGPARLLEYPGQLSRRLRRLGSGLQYEGRSDRDGGRHFMGHQVEWKVEGTDKQARALWKAPHER